MTERDEILRDCLLKVHQEPVSDQARREIAQGWTELSAIVRGLSNEVLCSFPSSIRDDAEDIAQVVLMKLFQRTALRYNACSVKSPTRFFKTIVQRAAIDRYRRRVKENEALPELQLAAARKGVNEASPGLEDDLTSLLGVLSKEDRALIEQRYLRGISISTLAAQHGVEYSAMATRIFRIMKVLKAEARRRE